MRLPPGPIAFLTQSNHFAMEVTHNRRQRGLGYSKFVSFGNQIDIRLYEYLDYIKDDPDTKVIFLYIEGLYVESVEDGREFLRTAKELAKKKPIVAIKVGTSSSGIRAATSHTGCLAGVNEIYDGAFNQAGIIRAVNSSELLDFGEALVKCPLPKSNRIAILTDGGGHGTMASDAAVRYGLEIPVLSKRTQYKLKEFLPPQASTKNPVDFAGGAEADLWNFVRCSEIILQDKDVDGLVIVGQYGGYGIEMASEFSELEERVSTELTKMVHSFNKPIINHTMYQTSKPKSLQILSEGGVPVYPVVETALQCMSILVEYKSYLDAFQEEEKEEVIELPPGRISKVREILNVARKTGRVNIVESEAREILKAYDLPISAYGLAKSKDEAIRIAEEIGYPVAMKIVSPEIVHKSDAGGVKLNLSNEDDVIDAFTVITNNARAYNREAELYGVIITPMEDKGIETIIGVTSDQTFGPTIMFGLGGIFVEVLKDVSFRVAPLTRRNAYDMIKQIKGFPILKGIRGQKPVDIDSLVAVIMKVSALVIENPDIRELDLNPVLAFGNGASIIDSRITLV